MTKQSIKTDTEIAVMRKGGKRLADVRETVAVAAKPGVTTGELDALAERLIRKHGGEPSFKLVAGYHHSTCISVNDEVVHGIPGKRKLLAGDVVAVDVGMLWNGFHTDTSTTVIVGGNKAVGPKVVKFLEVGRRTLREAIAAARPGNRVWDVSQAMQEGTEDAGYSVVRALTGHGIGRELHEEPAIPCFVIGAKMNSPKLTPGMVIAIEIMYNMGGSEVVYKNEDGWTISTADGKISGLFEETVAITKTGPQVLTAL